MSDKLIDALTQMDAKASGAPWGCGSGMVVGRRADGTPSSVLVGTLRYGDADISLCANLRNALPALIAFVEAADALRTRLTMLLDLLVGSSYHIETDEGEESVIALDNARARLLAAITGEKS